MASSTLAIRASSIARCNAYCTLHRYCRCSTGTPSPILVCGEFPAIPGAGLPASCALVGSTPKNGFCMSCSMRQLMVDCYNSNRPMVPYVIATKLHCTSLAASTQHQLTPRIGIAKHLRRGRQEDSHEFLRYFVDALQRSTLAAFPQ